MDAGDTSGTHDLDISGSKQPNETRRMLHGNFTHQRSAIRYRPRPRRFSRSNGISRYIADPDQDPPVRRSRGHPPRPFGPAHPRTMSGGSSSIRMILPYNSGPYLTRQTVSCSDLTAVTTGHLRRAYGHHSARRNAYGLETYL